MDKHGVLVTMEDDNGVVLSFYDALLKKSDLKLLEDSQWLNDNLITFCFEYFEREQFNHSADKIALISPEVTQFIKLAKAEELAVALEPLNLHTKQFVFLAVNDNGNTVGGTHWSLLIYVRNKQEFRHYDSCRGYNKETAHRLALKLQPHVRAPFGKMKFIEVQDNPQQENGHDCGVYVIATAEHMCRELCEGYSISLNDKVTPSVVKTKRQQLVDLIHKVAEEFKS